jgi:DNA polymerase II small subunit
MEMRSDMENIVKKIINSGYQIEVDAVKLLNDIINKNEMESFLEELLKRLNNESPKSIAITKDFVKDAISDLSIEKKLEQEIQPGLRIKKPLAKDIDSNIEIIDDPTDKIGSLGCVKDFKDYFRSRFEKISNLLRKRLDARNALSIDMALDLSPKKKVKIIAMIMSKKESSRFVILEIDDVESSALLLVPKENRELLDLAQNVVQDQVLCIEAIRGSKDFLIATNFIFPDVPERKVKKADIPIYAALLSDIHIGSKTFLEDSFSKFILWLNGNAGNSNQVEIASKVKYLLIAGDLVDGIGIYPRQEEELAITDIYKQYELMAQYIEQVPEYIEVIIIPGNHDAVRQALPQPAISKDYAEPIYEVKKVISLGNPAKIMLHGITFLMYHGRSLDDIISTLPNLDFQRPEKAMEFLLKSRHLAIEYGKRTSIAPMSEDYLVIDEPPDVFQAGHIHVLKNEVYRGISVVNCGAWQSQTEYQKRMGLIPTPGILPLINLQSMNLKVIDFNV